MTMGKVVNIEDMKTPQHMEFKAYAAFSSRLMVGFTIQGRYLQMIVNNRPTSERDAAKFKIDARITLDGEEIGVLDLERKTQWPGGAWPYQKINIPYRPFSVFENNEDGRGRYSSKVRELHNAYLLGRPGFWVGYSSPIADASGQATFVSRQACLVVPASHIFSDRFNPQVQKQPNRFGPPVNVISLDNDAGIICFSEEDFTEVIVGTVTEWMNTQGDAT
jgi:hypothetical protein